MASEHRKCPSHRLQTRINEMNRYLEKTKMFWFGGHHDYVMDVYLVKSRLNIHLRTMFVFEGVL